MTTMPRTSCALLAIAMASVACGRAGERPTADSAATSFTPPPWAYPVKPAGPTASSEGQARQLHVPGSLRSYSGAQIADFFTVPDWFPDRHPPMPPIVAHGRKPAVFACAYCHLPDGRGRPENAALAGLPSNYIRAQVADIKSGARRPALPSASPSFDFMHSVATSATAAEIDAAADYFSGLVFTGPRTKVVESDSAPTLRQLNGVYIVAGPNSEPLGRRLLDAATDGERHERHDPDVAYVTYVPPGSLARGRVIATTVTPTLSTPCVSCHGADLRGVDTIPPIAGRPPSYLLRQLFAFKAGTRATPRGQPMQGVVSRLTLDDMIAVAAYVGSVKP